MSYLIKFETIKNICILILQASDIPAFLEVGTPVSAKFKGAFCEASIKSVKKLVKFKVSFFFYTFKTIVRF